ncbi:acyltransferase family protein [Sphingomonas quercus]|uniref:Acyltransferase n=1 Tax=Sphingomonas quercus TaxID=2842451 RepID=A0ABS6BLS5_9SPHN|nr:acyltransferase [Sphingomonas quercus]MBU3078175.1 acyltransferase [Sphingomonas quercus]
MQHAAMPHRYPILDELRGIAALCVLLLHAFRPLMPHAYLAVDFFFLLSGFVIGLAYEERLADGRLSPAGFILARLRRLYPMLLAGLAFGLALMACSPARPTLSPLLLLNLLVIPIFGDVDAFPPDAPVWSLFMELAACVGYGLALPWLTTRRLAGLIAVSGLALIGIAWAMGDLSLGWQGSAREFFGAFPRVGWSFGLGLLTFRLIREGALRPPPVAAGVAPLLLVLALAAPLPAMAGSLLCVGIVFPLVLLAGIGAGEQRWSGPAAWLGRISYPLYILHGPATKFVGQLALPWPDFVLWQTLVVLASLACAAFAERYYERPLRAWLARRPDRSGAVRAGA